MSSFSKYGPPVLSAFAFIMFLILVCWYYLCYKPRRKAKKSAKLAEETRKKAAHQKSRTKSSRESSTCLTDHQNKYPTRYEDEEVYFSGPLSQAWRWTPYHINGFSYCVDMASNVYSMNYCASADPLAFTRSPAHAARTKIYSKCYMQANEKTAHNNIHTDSTTSCKTEHKQDNLTKGSGEQVRKNPFNDSNVTQVFGGETSSHGCSRLALPWMYLGTCWRGQVERKCRQWVRRSFYFLGIYIFVLLSS